MKGGLIKTKKKIAGRKKHNMGDTDRKRRASSDVSDERQKRRAKRARNWDVPADAAVAVAAVPAPAPAPAPLLHHHHHHHHQLAPPYPYPPMHHHHHHHHHLPSGFPPPPYAAPYPVPPVSEQPAPTPASAPEELGFGSCSDSEEEMDASVLEKHRLKTRQVPKHLPAASQTNSVNARPAEAGKRAYVLADHPEAWTEVDRAHFAKELSRGKRFNNAAMAALTVKPKIVESKEVVQTVPPVAAAAAKTAVSTADISAKLALLAKGKNIITTEATAKQAAPRAIIKADPKDPFSRFTNEPSSGYAEYARKAGDFVVA